MSYCRWSECDVYAYDSVEGGVRFCVAGGRRNLDRLCKTYNEAYQYMKTLRDQHGIDVPDYAIDELKADAIEEAKQMNGPHGVVSDLLAENAKLRNLAARMARALGVHGDWCTADCMREFGCSAEPCAIDQALLELGIEEGE